MMRMRSWNNLFKDLFLDFENEPFFESFAEDETLPGWLWECDDLGEYLSCSPEIEGVLGYSPQDMKGKPFTGFALTEKSARKISNVLKMGNFPIEISVDFFSQDGSTVPVSLFIYDAVTTEGKNTGLRGFAQVQLDQDKVQINDTVQTAGRIGVVNEVKKESVNNILLAHMEETGIERVEDVETCFEDGIELQVEETISTEISDDQKIKKTDSHIIRDLIVKGLEKIRMENPVIRDAALSRVTVLYQEEFRVDRTKEPLVNETLAGKVVHSYPKVLFKETEHRLEWGTKFDLTDEEKYFLSRYRLCPPGIQGFLQRRFAPKSILKCDYDWISVIILEELGKEPYVWVNYSREGEKVGGWSLTEVLVKPDLIFKGVEQSIHSPRKEKEILVRGENFLLG